MVVYRALRRLLAFALGVFFRQVEVAGADNVPDEGPVIFVGNHPNSLLDPALLLVTCGRVCRFAAKDVLFRGPLKYVLEALGAVPVARKSDHDGAAAATEHPAAERDPVERAKKNDDAFARLASVLADGGAMGIFPEGISHDESQLVRLKTGAARIALVAAARGVPVRIVPCGLTYVRRKRFRSRVLVQYGTPFTVDEERAIPDEREAARVLTERIDRALRSLTVNAPDWRTLTVLDAVRRMYQPPSVTLVERTELARRFAAVYPTVKDDPEVATLYRRVDRWLDELRATGLTDRELTRPPGAVELARRVVRQLALLLVWLPLALPGIVVHAPLGIAIAEASARLTPRKDVVATTKLLLGLLLVPLVLLGVLGLFWWRFGLARASLFAGFLALSGIATVRVLERGARLGRLVSSGLRSLSLRREIERLQGERTALVALVVAAVDHHRPSDMIPLFPSKADDA